MDLSTTKALLEQSVEQNVLGKALSEGQAFERLKAELELTFAAPEESYQQWTAQQMIVRYLCVRELSRGQAEAGQCLSQRL